MATDMFTIGWILVVVGIGLAIGLAATKKTFGVHPAILGVVIAGLIIGPFAMGWATLPAGEGGQTDITIVEPTRDTVYPTFDIALAVANTTQPAVLNDGETGYTIPFIANSTQHDIYQSDNVTQWSDPFLQFNIQPVPFAGATQDDLATIYFEVLDPDEEVDAASSGPYYLFVKSQAKRQLEWRVAGSATFDWIDGSYTMLMTDNVSLQLYIEADEGSLSRTQTAFSPITTQIKFTNGGTWSQMVEVDWIMLSTGTSTTNHTPGTW